MVVHADQFADVLHGIEQNFPEVTPSYAGVASHPQWFFINITSNSATRVNAFDSLVEWYGVEPENVMTFGDAQSDCIFLQKAGVGIAMGNANDQVKACASFVTEAVWDDGVAYALARLIP